MGMSEAYAIKKGWKCRECRDKGWFYLGMTEKKKQCNCGAIPPKGIKCGFNAYKI